MVRMSALRNRPVISGNRQIGLIQSISLDPAQKRVLALIVSRGLRGKCIIRPEHVRTITERFILADRIVRYDRTYESRSSRFVRDTNGALIGMITDFALQPDTMTVSAVEFVSGLLPPERRIRIWTYVFQKQIEDALTIPSLMSEEPTFSEEGM